MQSTLFHREDPSIECKLVIYFPVGHLPRIGVLMSSTKPRLCVVLKDLDIDFYRLIMSTTRLEKRNDALRRAVMLRRADNNNIGAGMSYSPCLVQAISGSD